MKKVSLLLLCFTLLLGACGPKKIKVRGEVTGLKGTVKLLAEMPGERSLVVLAQQEVTDGKIDLRTDQIMVPARVWVDVDGKQTVEMILDTPDMIWIEGKIKFPDQIRVTGSGLMDEYAKLQKKFKQDFEDEISTLDKKIMKISEKEKMSRDDEVLLGVHFLRKQRLLGQRAETAKKMIELNPDQELALFLLKDELRDSLDAQKKLFKKITVANTESNVYKVLESKLK